MGDKALAWRFKKVKPVHQLRIAMVYSFPRILSNYKITYPAIEMNVVCVRKRLVQIQRLGGKETENGG